MRAFVVLPGISCDRRDLILDALALFSRFDIDFGDACIAASALQQDVPVCSFDRDFDAIPGVRRFEP
jgi:predicted nucleic acid-binding protein